MGGGRPESLRPRVLRVSAPRPCAFGGPDPEAGGQEEEGVVEGGPAPERLPEAPLLPPPPLGAPQGNPAESPPPPPDSFQGNLAREPGPAREVPGAGEGASLRILSQEPPGPSFRGKRLGRPPPPPAPPGGFRGQATGAGGCGWYRGRQDKHPPHIPLRSGPAQKQRADRFARFQEPGEVRPPGGKAQASAGLERGRAGPGSPRGTFSPRRRARVGH
ncbi:PREDICTED: basic salivary proline-rich protein 1-like [Ceratotherium simum simum]|uniref:Basic salivary proline-rich protein 1-like n=1 Tax=Ceratotherium simum simum TaxID=73337 RepID=A0ABM1DKK1_CERSS|nr:PREDICTED: basic salivary proline-rich protein 1-like [Ceratotherium simum simum]